MINESLHDEEFIVKTLDTILNPEEIESVKYHNKILFKVLYIIDRVYDYDDSQEVVNLIKKCQERNVKMVFLKYKENQG